MTVEQAIEERLKAESGVTALVSTRIYQLKLPQSPTLPAVRLFLVDDPETKHLRGPNGLKAARVQVDAYEKESAASPYDKVSEIAAEVNASLVMEPFVVEGSPGAIEVQGVERVNRRVLYEAEELRLLRVFQDYRVWYRER